jgi:hypothetical protein
MHSISGKKQAFLAILLMAGLALAAGPARAHHGGAVFDRSAQKQIAGTVKTFEYTNPHCWIWLDVPNDQGGVDTWGFEGTSPNSLSRNGWSRTTLKPGDKITVIYYPLKDGSKGGSFIRATRPNGDPVKGDADPAEH